MTATIDTESTTKPAPRTIESETAAVERAIDRAVRVFYADVDTQRSPLTARSMRIGAYLAWSYVAAGGYGSHAFGDAVRLAKRSGMEREAWVAACVAAWERQEEQR